MPTRPGRHAFGTWWENSMAKTAQWDRAQVAFAQAVELDALSVELLAPVGLGATGPGGPGGISRNVPPGCCSNSAGRKTLAAPSWWRTRALCNKVPAMGINCWPWPIRLWKAGRMTPCADAHSVLSFCDPGMWRRL